MTDSGIALTSPEETLGQPPGQHRAALLVGLGIAGLTLRPQVVAIGPLLPAIQTGLNLSHSIAGLLASIPVLCMGAFAPLTPFFARRIGFRHGLVVALGLISFFGVVRVLVPSAILVILLTVPVGIGMGLAGAMLPVVVKGSFGDRPAFATGVYATGIMIGSTVAAAGAVPLADIGGGWRASLGLMSAATAALAVASMRLTRASMPRERARPLGLPLRRRVAWRLVCGFVLMSFVFYGLNSWLPDTYVERGWSQQAAGGLTGVMNAVTIPSAFLVAWIADHRGSRRAWLGSMAALQLIGVLGVVLVPTWAWVWAVLLGASVGPLFPLTMMLPLDVAERPAEVAAVTAMMLGVGYSLAAVSPLLLGGIRDITGGFAAVMWVIAGAAAALIAVYASSSLQPLHTAAACQGCNDHR